MKRQLEAFAAEYASKLKKEKTVKTKAQHVVDALTMWHGSKFPVAVNDFTRPTVCGVLRTALGKDYEKICIAGKAGPMLVPELPSQPPGHVAAKVPTLHEMRQRFPDDAADLLQNGGQCFALLTAEEVATVTCALSTHCTEPKHKPLDPALGNGSHGAYATLSSPLPALLQRVEEAACQWIIDHAGTLTDVKRQVNVKGKSVRLTASGEAALRGTSELGKHKTLLLRYGLGGINYAHHDACGDFQALLMLSRPGVDYTGGEFYLGDANPPFATKAFPFAHAGELLIFRGRQGNGSVKYLHGMQEVFAGSAAVTRRFAVGFFQ